MEQVDLAEEPDPEENNMLVDPAGSGKNGRIRPSTSLSTFEHFNKSMRLKYLIDVGFSQKS